MSSRSCNSPLTTGEEAARTNAKYNSGNGVRGNSSRRTRCRGSGRRATCYRLNSESWAARSKHNNVKLKHEDVVSMMERRSFEARRARVTDVDVKRWVEEEDFERDRGAEMVQMDAVLAEAMEPVITHPPHGSIPEERPDGIFRGLLVQLNGMVTRQVKN